MLFRSANEVTPSEVPAGEALPAEIHKEEIAGVVAQAGETAVEEHTASEAVAEPIVAEVHTEGEVLESPAPSTEPPAEVADVGVEASVPPEEVKSGLSPSSTESHVKPVDPHSEITAEFPLPSEVLEEQAASPALEATPEVSELLEPVSEKEIAPSAVEQTADAVDSPGFVNPPPTVEESAAPPVVAPFDVSQLSEAEQKIHKDAKRFAKLLVSEIELYNKAKVAEGRKNWDLYKRLKSDIDRSRMTFEKRFGKALSRQVDYFHDELVKILAANDSEVLGPGYPGPSA